MKMIPTQPQLSKIAVFSKVLGARSLNLTLKIFASLVLLSFYLFYQLIPFQLPGQPEVNIAIQPQDITYHLDFHSERTFR